MNEDVSVYPTTTKGEVSISLSGNIKYMVHIYDITGSLVKSLSDVSGFQQLYLNNLHSGLYIVTITSMMGVKKVVKVIKE
ncbi:T9SS type A sorting domain-containing protein [Saccharicrinis sp. FJH2]|uniref:T9SS type A sorting domain-containing protein n=1 Tax=unclassified Saccharicrinis TaxID=2646859 RepID=UPI0035D4F966